MAPCPQMKMRDPILSSEMTYIFTDDCIFTGALLIWFPHLVRYRHPLWKVAHSVILVSSYKARLYCNHFRSKPSLIPTMTADTSLIPTMTADTAPFRLFCILALLDSFNFNILFSIVFSNSDQFAACWGSALTTQLVRSFIMCCVKSVGYS